MTNLIRRVKNLVQITMIKAQLVTPKIPKL